MDRYALFHRIRAYLSRWGFEEKQQPMDSAPVVPVLPLPRRGEPQAAPSLGLALQGGGALGAFTWGVLDRLLEEPGLPRLSLSGSSAGAVNACVLASHFTRGGPPAAREALERLWRRVSEAGNLTPQGALPGWLPMPRTGTRFGMEALGMVSRILSPSQFNPFNLNPLKGILEDEIDFDAIRDPACPRLMIAATRVRDGSCRIFTNDDLNLDALLASCTLPQLHHATEIEGEAYWDGGYSANPPLIALVEQEGPGRILLVRLISADFGTRTPKSAREIQTRLNQIAFSRPLSDELAALGHSPSGPAIDILTLDSRLAARAWTGLGTLDWRYLERLHARGRKLAGEWIAAGWLR